MSPSDPKSPEWQGVEAQIETYRRAILAADWDAWGNTLTEDVFLSPPNATPVAGREAAVAWVKAFPTITSFTINIDEVTGFGDHAYARGRYELEMSLPDGTPIQDSGAWLEIHRRRNDGQWPYTHLMFHSTEPLSSAPPE